MEKELNIAAILEDKPVGLKFYSSTFGYIKFNGVHKDKVYFYSEDTNAHSVKQNGKMYDGGECIIFPSKEMHDWSKFAWKKGNVLIKTTSEYCVGIFDKWTSDDYSTFSAKYINLGLSDNFSCNYTCKTEEWKKTENSKNYISKIEHVMNGKLNLQTLEIQTQPKFKDGDIVALVVQKCTHIAIFQSRQEAYIGFHAVLCQNDELLLEEPFREDVGDIELHLATDSEKQQLFDALAKKGKAWDSEKKQVVDLKPNVELKPFDKVVVRDTEYSTWCADLFSHIDVDYRYACVGATWSFCIPYNEETAKLIGTTNNVEG